MEISVAHDKGLHIINKRIFFLIFSKTLIYAERVYWVEILKSKRGQ